MMSLTFGLFTKVSGSGPLGPLVFDITCITIWISTFYKIRYFDSQKLLHVSCFQRKLFHLRPLNKQC